MKNNTSKNTAIVIMKREMGAFFTSPIAYIVTGLFLLFSGFLFFSTFFLANSASMRYLFSLMPILLAFFIPALTMRLFSEEQRSGSLETLMTLPVSSFDVVAGKYLAAVLFSLVMIAPTLIYALSICFFGKMDGGVLFCQYLGTIFLACAFTSIGVFASSVTKNQIVAFFVAFAACILLAMIDNFLVLLPASIVGFLNFFSANSHFTSIARGILDSRDILYFISVTVLFFGLTVKSVENRRAM